jgi:hypothetical protein
VLAIAETSYVDFPSDPGLVTVALRFGVAPDALLGHGGEAWVYALDDERVLRVLHDGGCKADVLRRMALVEDLALSQPAYRLPDVLDVGEVEGRTYAIERRLPGRSVLQELGRIEGAARERLIEAYLDISASLGDLLLPARTGFGDLIAADSIVAPTWRAYLQERAARNLSRSTPELRQVDPAGIADGLPDASTPRSSTWTRSRAISSPTAPASPRCSTSGPRAWPATGDSTRSHRRSIFLIPTSRPRPPRTMWTSPWRGCARRD